MQRLLSFSSFILSWLFCRFLMIPNLARIRPFVSTAQLLILVKATVAQEFIKQNLFKGKECNIKCDSDKEWDYVSLLSGKSSRNHIFSFWCILDVNLDHIYWKNLQGKSPHVIHRKKCDRFKETLLFTNEVSKIYSEHFSYYLPLH